MRRERRWKASNTVLIRCIPAILAMGLGDSSRGQPASPGLREGLRDLINSARDQVYPALVNIHVVTVDYWDGKEHKDQSVGSGTIFSTEGHVITNQHVTHRGQKFRCTLSDKREVPAKLVGEDPLTDLAVLKLDVSALKDGAGKLPVAVFGNSDEIEVGDYVMAMGSPLALSRSVTLGIVSNPERVFTGSAGDDVDEMELEEGQRTGLFTRWIQHDAMIQPGNSGGPLVNLKGEIIGINELGGSAMGFAIPSNLAKSVAATLVEHGEVKRSWIGLSFKNIEKTGLREGVLVNSVVEGGPAARAGIQAGDTILSVNGERVTIRFPEEIPSLMKKVADLPIGSSLPIEFSHKGEKKSARVVTSLLEKDRGDETCLRTWGVTILEITEKMARDRRLDDRQGVLIGSVRSGGPAQTAEPAITRGDVLRSIDGERVTDVKSLVKLYDRLMAMEELPEHLLVEFERNGRSQVTLVKPKPDEEEDPPREVAKAWIGVATQPVLEKLAAKLGHPKQLGFRITRIYPRTLAAQSDLKVGDVVVSLNGTPLRPRGMQDAGLFARSVRKRRIDEKARLGVLRDGKQTELSVTLERTRLTVEEARRDRNRDFEMTVRELTFFDRDENRWDESVQGVIVEGVEDAGWAGLGGVESGDLIQRINDRPIRGLKSYRKVMEDIAKEQPARVVVALLRGVQTRFQYIEPDWKPVLKEDVKSDGQQPGAKK